MEGVEVKGLEIEAALEEVKRAKKLCDEFDNAVDEAKSLPFYETDPVSALELVARRYERLDVFLQFWDTLSFEPIEAPSVGDYVRLTMADGSTREGEVTGSYRSNTNPEIRVEVDRSRLAWIPLTQGQKSRAYRNTPMFLVVKVEHIERPRKVMWPTGTLVESRSFPGIYRRVAEDVYEGAEFVRFIGGSNKPVRVSDYRKAED